MSVTYASRRPFRDQPDATSTTTTSTTSTTEAPTTTTDPPRPPAAPTPARASRSAGYPNWEALRQCESGGNYSTNTGNGFYGAYQFELGTWQGLGYEGLPSDASPSTQDEAAQRLYEARGSSPWPVCGRLL